VEGSRRFAEYLDSIFHSGLFFYDNLLMEKLSLMKGEMQEVKRRNCRFCKDSSKGRTSNQANSIVKNGYKNHCSNNSSVIRRIDTKQY
jgi:hypothetical protein